MRFVLNPRAKAVTVFTSKREPIEVRPGGMVDTTDEPLIARLKDDATFSEAKDPPKTEPVIGRFVTESPAGTKRKPGRPKKVADDGNGTQAASA